MSIERITNFACSITFLLVSLFFPFFVALQYHESVPVKTMHIAVGMYVLTVATSTRNLFVFIMLVFCAIDMFATYGAFKPDEHFSFSQDIFDGMHWIIYTSTIIGLYERAHLHLRLGQPFLPFKYITKRWEDREYYH